MYIRTSVFVSFETYPVSNTLFYPKYLCIKYEKSTKSNQENRNDINFTNWHANQGEVSTNTTEILRSFSQFRQRIS